MSDTTHNPAPHLLLVEDNPADVGLFRLSLRGMCTVAVAQDGEEALAYLHRTGPFQEVPAPQLIVLDLNLPKRSGLEVLATIKADPVLRIIPVMVLSTSTVRTDIVSAYALGAAAYLRKPTELDEVIRMVEGIESFWFSVASLPAHGSEHGDAEGAAV